MAVGQSEQATSASAPAGEGEGEGEGGGVRLLDFSQPTKFTTDMRRRLTGAVESFADAVSQELSSQLKCDVELTVGEVTQDTWAAARSRLPADTLSVGIQGGAPERALLLSVERGFLAQALECLLGGRAAQATAERRLTELDWSLAEGLLDTVVEGLSRAWVELDGPALKCGELDLEGDGGVSAPAAEPTLLVALQSTIDGLSSAMALLMPWASVELIAESARAHHHHPPAAAGAGEGLRNGLAAAQVLLRAEIGTAQMPIERMLSIGPGTLVELSEAAGEGVVLYAEEVSVGRGRPGRSGTRRALKLESSDDNPVRADTYAKLGRAELERARAHAEATRGEESPGILRNIFVRVWAELGRTHMALGGTLELTPGAVVELDQDIDEPVELFVNGVCFANGALLVTGAGSWGIQVQSLLW
jgi:flagellar motor switch protein FliM